ncbi:PHD finger protein MALE MEIOCYTE DEATH 1 [Bienertia sinuspersici]
MSVWCTLLVQENKGIVLPLYTIEENVVCSEIPFCDHCRCSGTKYHLIIPHESEWNKQLNSDVLELQTHLLHGLIHCNGFGHLLCINGIDGGSKYLCGRELMDLWDRICTNLRVRKVTLEDTSKKRSMDLRLLHAFFGVQEHHYQKAVEVISNYDLTDLVGVLPKTNKTEAVKQIIYSYRTLSESDVTTLRDLLKFMLTLNSQTPSKAKVALARAMPLADTLPRIESGNMISRPQRSIPIRLNTKPSKCRKFAALVASMDSRWPKRRLEFTAEVIVNALKENRERKSNKSGMTRQEVRDAARAHIGDTGLLDYVLKSMNNVTVGDYTVKRRIDPVNRVLEYTIHDVGEGESSPSPRKSCREKASSAPVLALSAASSGSDTYNDIRILYRHMLLNLPESHISGLSVKVILDSKHLEYYSGELIVLPLYASVGDLKAAAQHALRDTYCIMENFVVRDIDSLGNLSDDDAVFGAIESGSEIWVKGSRLDLKTEYKYEGGPDNWTVRCSCGATDDDGERMVSCDICEVWQHTRCIGIEDREAVPPLFVCEKCCSSLMPPRMIPTHILKMKISVI